MTKRLAASVLVIALFPGCATRGLNFVQDKRVTITSPGDRALVKPPVTIQWRARNFQVTGKDGKRRNDAGYFGIYVDRAPQPPGRTQEWIVREDQVCNTTPGCPNQAYLAGLNIHGTNETAFTIERLVDIRPETQKDRREFHEVTIVLLNGKGERIGESAFSVEFELDRDE